MVDQPALALGTELIVTAPDGRNVADGPPTLVDTTVRQDLVGPLPAGRYTVVWRVTSADGHPISGSFTFSTTQATTGPAPTTSATALPPTTTAPPTSVNSGTGSPPITGGLLGALIGIGIALVAAGGVLILWLTRRRHERST